MVVTFGVDISTGFDADMLLGVHGGAEGLRIATSRFNRHGTQSNQTFLLTEACLNAVSLNRISRDSRSLWLNVDCKPMFGDKMR